MRRKFESTDYDTMAGGKLAPEDVAKLLATLEPPTILSDAELRSFLITLDADYDGRVSKEEVIQWYLGSGDQASTKGYVDYLKLQPEAHLGYYSLSFVSFCSIVSLGVGSGRKRGRGGEGGGKRGEQGGREGEREGETD